MEKYELVVIGSGPGGEKAAVKAAYFKHRVALIEKSSLFGGCAVQEAIPAKILKEIAFHLSGKVEKGLYGTKYYEHQSSMELLLNRTHALYREQSQEVKENLLNHNVSLYFGEASFASPHVLKIKGETEQEIYGENIIIATGSTTSQFPSQLPVDGKRVHNSKSILNLKRMPKSLCIVGMGISGCEYGSLFSLMGTKIFFVNRNSNVLPYFDRDIVRFLRKSFAQEGAEIILDQVIESIETPKEEDELFHITLTSGERFDADMILYASGRVGNVKSLNLDTAGVAISERQTIPVDAHYRTNIEHIYAVGDVIGQSLLANVAMDQGRIAVAHILKTEDITHMSSIIPFGMYTTPEVSSVGMLEEVAKAQNLDYGVGIAYYADTPRGEFTGSEGMMKLIFTKKDNVIRGVHIVGALATEIIHYGVCLVRDEKDLLFLISEAFNYPSLHEVYKYAAYDALSSLTGYRLRKTRKKVE